MESENNNKFYKKKEKIYKDMNYSYNDEILQKEKSDILPYADENKKNSKVYIKLDPEYLENNYKKAEQYFSNYNQNKTNTYNPNYTDNKYINSEKVFKKKALYFKKKPDINSPVKNSDIYLIYNNNSVNINPKKSSINENKTVSPIKKYIEKKNFNFYINNGINHKRYRNSNLDEENYINKSLELSRLNNRNINNYLNDSKTFQTQRNKDFPYLNIYQKKMITIFVQIIKKIIEKNIKRNILNSFFNKIKGDNFKNEENKNKTKFKKINTKYNEYKNIINNYVKNISKNEKELNNNNEEPKYNSQRNNNSLINQKTEDDIKKLKFKEMQKKYGKIYERKKNLNNPNNYKNYMLRKTKTQNTFVKPQNTKNEEILNEPIIFKTKLLNSKLLKNRKKFSQINLSQDFNNIDSYRNENKINMKREETQPKNDNKIIVKKVKINKRLSNSLKRENRNNKKEETYEIYNIKNIITPDKRLYVFINYITLYHKKKSGENSLSYYDEDLLQVSNQDNFHIYGINNKNPKNKTKLNNYFLKNLKKLSEIKEEPNDNILASGIKNTPKNKINTNIEKGIVKLELFSNNLKKEIIKNSINNKVKK